MTQQVWQKGYPPKHGYYLGAHEHLGQIIVSELWFNPDSIGKWYFSRGYTGQPSRGMADRVPATVIRWMPIPEPPEEIT